MASIDKVAIAWTIAIVAVGAGFAGAGMSNPDIASTPSAPVATAPTMAAAPSTTEMEKEEPKADPFADIVAKNMESAGSAPMMGSAPTAPAESSVSVSAPKVEAAPKMSGPQTVTVDMPAGTSVPGCEETNECYIPASVTINAGDTVAWDNLDTAAHTVTSGTPANGPDGMFDSSLVMGGAIYEYTFNEPGSYDYFCMVHPWMVGDVQVN